MHSLEPLPRQAKLVHRLLARCGSQTPKESLMSTFRLLLTASPSSFRRLFRESLAEVTSVVVMLFTVSLGLMSQVAPTTKLSGEVVDSSGAYLPGAKIDLVMSGTQFTRHTVTNGEGRFVVDLLPPGAYELNVSGNGFATFHQSGIQLDVNVPANLKVSLTVRGTVQQVNVIENTPMLDTESGTLRQVVNERYIHEMPLEGRNAAALVFMAPGTVAGKGTDRATYASTSDT